MINRIDNNNSINSKTYNQKINRAIEFGKILQDIQDNKTLKFSSHAMERLKERNINLTDTDVSKLTTAVNHLRDKGGKEALILYNNIAFITSVKNNTVITAVNEQNIKDNVFTNIDSAIII